jgi:hypothetical protein
MIQLCCLNQWIPKNFKDVLEVEIRALTNYNQTSSGFSSVFRRFLFFLAKKEATHMYGMQILLN